MSHTCDQFILNNKKKNVSKSLQESIAFMIWYEEIYLISVTCYLNIKWTHYCSRLSIVWPFGLSYDLFVLNVNTILLCVLLFTHRAVDAQSQQHNEEHNSPKCWARKCRNCLRVNDKHQARSYMEKNMVWPLCMYTVVSVWTTKAHHLLPQLLYPCYIFEPCIPARKRWQTLRRNLWCNSQRWSRWHP